MEWQVALLRDRAGYKTIASRSTYFRGRCTPCVFMGVFVPLCLSRLLASLAPEVYLLHLQLAKGGAALVAQAVRKGPEGFPLPRPHIFELGDLAHVDVIPLEESANSVDIL